MVGPFAIIDHISPAIMDGTENLDVSPHTFSAVNALLHLANVVVQQFIV